MTYVPTVSISRGMDPAGEEVVRMTIVFYQRVALDAITSEVHKLLAKALRGHIANDAAVKLAIADEIKSASANLPIEAIKTAVREAMEAARG